VGGDRSGGAWGVWGVEWLWPGGGGGQQIQLRTEERELRGL